MKSRLEIKAQAKRAFYDQYWIAVGFLVVVGVVTGIASWIVSSAVPMDPFMSGLLSCFFTFPVWISLCLFAIKVYNGKNAEMQDSLAGFKPYGRNIGGMFWMYLWIIIWSLLFVIPGLIKFLFHYIFAPYLLAEYPQMKAQDAIKISMKIVSGYKGDLFIFYLSFLGWYILSALTCGILCIFYVGPYYLTALAGYYQELKNNALSDGRITAIDLGGTARAASYSAPSAPSEPTLIPNTEVKEIEIDMKKHDQDSKTE